MYARLRAGLHPLRAHVPVGEGAVGRDRRRHEPGVHGGRRGRRGRLRLVRELRLRRQHRGRHEAGARGHAPSTACGAPEKLHTPGPARDRRRRRAPRHHARPAAEGIAFDVDGELGLAVVPGDREVNEFALDARVRARDRPPLHRRRLRRAPRAARRATSARDFAGAKLVVADSSVRAPHGWITGANEIDHHATQRGARPRLHADAVGRDRDRRARRPVPEAAASPLRIDRGIEVGHVFQLGTKYTEALGAHLHRRARRAAPDGDGLLRHRGEPRSSPRSSRSTTTRTASRGRPRSRRSTCTSIAMPGRRVARPRPTKLADELAAAGRRRALRRPRRPPGREVRRRRPGRDAGAGDRGAKGIAQGDRRAQGARATGERDEIPLDDAVATHRRGQPRDPAGHAAGLADAGEARPRDAGRGAVGVRAEVGRLPLHRVPRRQGHRARQPQREAAHPLLPRPHRAAAEVAARRGGARRRDRDQDRRTASTSTCCRSGSTRPRAA